MKKGCLNVNITTLESDLHISLSTVCSMGIWSEPFYLEDGLLLVDYRDRVSPLNILKQ